MGGYYQSLHFSNVVAKELKLTLGCLSGVKDLNKR